MKKTYAQFKKEQQTMVNEMPYVRYAFGERQLKEVFEDWGLSYPGDMDKATSIWGIGDIIQKKDVPAFKDWEQDWEEQHDREFAELITDDDFVLDMFMYELGNHEFQISYDVEDVINACGFEIEEFATNERLCNLFNEARKDYLQMYFGDDWF